MFLVWINEIFSLKRLIVLFSCSQSVTKNWKQRTQAKSQRNTRLASSFCLCTGQFCGDAATLTLSFLFWLWPNQKEPLSNLKAVIKPTWTKQRSTEISWNFTTVCTHAGDTKHYLFRVWQRKLDSHCLTSFWHEHLGFFWPVSTWCERRNFRKLSVSFSTRFSKKILTKWKIQPQERLEVGQERLENEVSGFASRLEVLTAFRCGFIWAHLSTTSFSFLVRIFKIEQIPILNGGFGGLPVVCFPRDLFFLKERTFLP